LTFFKFVYENDSTLKALPPMQNRLLKIHPKDNVLVALSDLKAGEMICWDEDKVMLVNDIPAKHKLTLKALAEGDFVWMYGTIVGKAKTYIHEGAALTTDNLVHAAMTYGAKTKEYHWQAPDVTKWKNRTFLGYHRKDGQVGTANIWLVIPLVFCENRNVETIYKAFEDVLGFSKPNPYKKLVAELAASYQSGDLQKEDLLTDIQKNYSEDRLFKNLDGIRYLTHQGGCGGTRLDSDALCALFAGYIHNPNVAGATVLSLGCQNAQPSILKEKLNKLQPIHQKPVIILEQQQEGKEEQLLQAAVKQTFLALTEVNKIERKPAPLDKLTVGLECGGSDGFSGISANPSVGHASDLIIALGGKTILSEFPELCGVEQELINRCMDQESASKFSHLMQAYAKAANAVGSGFDMNPSPGNIKDGLITDAIKSAGAAKKGGTSPIVDVLDYTEYVTKPGLNLLCTPGNDVESTTAMAASGANIMLFTTGLGTPTGNPITPVIKVSSNSTLTQKMPDIIDVDTGPVITGEKSISQMGEEILEKVIAVASGEVETKAMILGQFDFIPWKRGVSL
jgi:altronate hydrolase